MSKHIQENILKPNKCRQPSPLVNCQLNITQSTFELHRVFISATAHDKLANKNWIRRMLLNFCMLCNNNWKCYHLCFLYKLYIHINKMHIHFISKQLSWFVRTLHEFCSYKKKKYSFMKFLSLTCKCAKT